MAQKAKKNKQKRKLAIVMSGGGMRCIYGVGVLTALVEEYGLTEPDIIVASSGGAGGATYYLSGQYREIISIWLSLFSQKGLVSFRRRKVVDIDEVVYKIFKERYPLDFKKLASTRTRLLFVATRVRDGQTVYLKVPKNGEIYEYIRATAAIPVVYGKRVTIGKEEYVDGDFGSDTEDLVRKALALGAQDVIAIESNPPEFSQKEKAVVMNALRALAKMRKDTGMVQALGRELMEEPPVTVPKGSRVIRVAPLKNLHMGTLKNKKLKLRVGFNLGYADARDNKELQKLLK